ncbi:hypothetical protein D9M69_432210 [compost metagenome]
MCHPDRDGLSSFLDGGFGPLLAVGHWRLHAGGGRGVGKRGDAALIIRGVPNAHALYGFGDYLQPGLYVVWRHGAAHRHVADHDDGQRHVTGVLFDRDHLDGNDRWIDVVGNVKDIVASRGDGASRCAPIHPS